MALSNPSLPSLDLMSELLLGMRLRGIEYRRIEVAPPFGLSFGNASQRAHLHVVVSGAAFLRSAEGRIFSLPAGTAVFLPHGGKHQLLSAIDIPCRDITSFTGEPLCDALSEIRDCAGKPGCPDNTLIFSSCMEFDLGGMQRLVRLMPEALIVGTLSERHPEVLPILTAMESEVCGRRVGFGAILARLADVLSAIIVRGWVECGCDGAAGLVDALRDPRLAGAIAALHRDPGRTWTVADLAAETGASRSVFAERFHAVTGVTPLRYAAELRMRLATQWIGSEQMPIDTVAHRLGYASQAAFSRAFKRVTGQPPGIARASQLRPPDQRAVAETAFPQEL
ncbi:AraC family transcriptional regulator [Acidisoma cellulosilytica]|uniref:AraC family transcriptional regulator n=1 Tax=Acidisoma cellulosilyticum TaxID=2802395 RepID=A0A963Z3Z1_9PROT|nr:AraC family transcriptional regulator [Acidisoma cellulosilyticum]MCB8882174.1 AraC family transcriptional regulator [Acidisoma cellulosilyticum]